MGNAQLRLPLYHLLLDFLRQQHSTMSTELDVELDVTSPITRTDPHPGANTVFRHPSYPDNYNIFLELHTPGKAGGALRYGLAHTACALVAGNTWDGYFTFTRDGLRLEFNWDDLLPERSHYFHVTTPTAALNGAGEHGSNSEHYLYPVFPSFDHWQFPHDTMPFP